MLRIKIPQGILTADQLGALADVGERYSRRFGHITTRQNIQFHFVKLHDVEPAMRRLADAGLTTREACGNSVRNITGVSVRGRLGRRALRRHAVRRRTDAVPPASPSQLDAAAQVQDRLRGVRRGSHRDRHQRSRLPRRARRRRRARLPRPGRRRHGDHVQVGGRHPRVHCRRPRSSASPRRCCACSSGSATTSTSSATA